MSTPEPTLDDIRHSVRHAVRLHWNMFLAQGAIMIILGALAIVWPEISTLAASVYIGMVFLLAGLAGFVIMALAPTVSAFLWSLLTAVLALMVGVLLLWHPVAGAVSLTLVLVAFFVVEGVAQTAVSIAYRAAFPESWGWMLFSGIADLILAGLIVAGWPGSARWALGLIVGVNLITSGAATTMVAVSARHAVSTVQRVLGGAR